MTHNSPRIAVVGIVAFAIASASLTAQADDRERERERVVVINTVHNPVPVLTQSNDPFIVQEAAGDSSQCAPQCILYFPTVPVGKRLVITNVTAQISSTQSVLVIEGNGATIFVPKNYPTADYLAVPVLDYFEAGKTPSARFFVPDATQHTSLIVTFSGYFVPTP